MVLGPLVGDEASFWVVFSVRRCSYNVALSVSLEFLCKLASDCFVISNFIFFSLFFFQIRGCG